MERVETPANWGLAFHKYVAWPGGKADPGIERFVGKRVPAAYKVAFENWKEGIAKLPDCLRLEAQTQTSLVYGSGDKAVHETGLTFNWTYGVPALRGSSLKGAMRRSAREMLRLEDVLTDDVKPDAEETDLLENFPDRAADLSVWFALFGSTACRAGIVVHDAWLVPSGNGECPLRKDVLTVHHPDYYQQGSAPPSDMDDPTPIPFLAVRPGVRFMFAIQAPSEWSGFVKECALRAMAAGLGGKTNSNYGRMAPLPTLTAIKNGRMWQIDRKDVLVDEIPTGATFKNGDKIQVTMEGRKAIFYSL